MKVASFIKKKNRIIILQNSFIRISIIYKKLVKTVLNGYDKKFLKKY